MNRVLAWVGAALGQAQNKAQRVELGGRAHPGKQAGHKAPDDEDAAQKPGRSNPGAPVESAQA